MKTIAITIDEGTLEHVDRLVGRGGRANRNLHDARELLERGHKPSDYIVVSRDFIAGHDDVSTVVCAPIYGEVLGLRAEIGRRSSLP